MTGKKVKFLDYECDVVFERYFTGNTAMRLDCNGERIAMCTLNLPEIDQLEEGEVFIKNYSENEGMLDALINAGVVEDTGRKVQYNYPTHDIDFPIVKIKARGES